MLVTRTRSLARSLTCTCTLTRTHTLARVPSAHCDRATQVVSEALETALRLGELLGVEREAVRLLAQHEGEALTLTLTHALTPTPTQARLRTDEEGEGGKPRSVADGKSLTAARLESIAFELGASVAEVGPFAPCLAAVHRRPL